MSGIKIFDSPEIYMGDTVSFEVFPAEILGFDFKRVKIVSVLSPADAVRESDVVVKHAQSLPYLEAAERTRYKNYTDYSYLKVKTMNGSYEIIGIPWVKQSTLVKITSNVGRFEIEVDDPAAFNDILSLLRARGFTKIAFSSVD